MPDESSATPRDFFAAERAFLAWIRTGLALMSLGFVLAHFGLFLQEFSFNQPNLRAQSYGLSRFSLRPLRLRVLCVNSEDFPSCAPKRLVLT